jgi:hypothetical protein
LALPPAPKLCMLCQFRSLSSLACRDDDEVDDEVVDEEAVEEEEEAAVSCESEADNSVAVSAAAAAAASAAPAPRPSSPIRRSSWCDVDSSVDGNALDDEVGGDELCRIKSDDEEQEVEAEGPAARLAASVAAAAAVVGVVPRGGGGSVVRGGTVVRSSVASTDEDASRTEADDPSSITIARFASSIPSWLCQVAEQLACIRGGGFSLIGPDKLSCGRG